MQKAQAKKEVWHSLVRDVFARYYLKLREPFPDLLPNLPRRYSRDWEQQMQQGLEHILTVDFQGVDKLLKTCGFGTPSWQHFIHEVLPRIEQLINEQVEQANDEDLPLVLNARLQTELSDVREEVRKLRIGGRRALEQLRAYERQLEESPPFADPKITNPEFESAQFLEPSAEDNRRLNELEQENSKLRGQLATHEQNIAALNNQLEDLENDMSLLPAPAVDDDDLRTDLHGDHEAEELLQKNAELQKNLRAKEHTVGSLRGRVEELEDEMGSARDQLLDEVKKLKELTSGQIEIKATAELEYMDADSLLSYAQDVATDLDVRRQTFDESLKGIDTLKNNYGESHERYEKQQLEIEQQLEKMVGELQVFEEQAQRQEEQNNLRENKQGEDQSEKNSAVLTAQSEQLRLLSGRIKELQDSNRTLNESNQKTYRDLDTAIKRIIPLRKQIEELESLRDTLTNYIRQKYDRTFTMRKLN
ncbi:MAG: chromosome segregation ATPase [Candidatus Latescibacterota bacterium]|jgi:chromosome segregation ATPase